MLLHDLEELDHDLRHRADEDLALATLLRVEDAAEAVVQHRHTHHGCWSSVCRVCVQEERGGAII